MRLKYAILVMMLLSTSHQHELAKRESGHEKRVVCYYTNWSVYRPGTAKFNPQNINPYLCTHLIYAFGGLDRENGLRPYDKYQDIEQGGYAKFTGLKTYNKALKTMLAIGGWNEGSARFSPLVADEERRKDFVKNVVKFLRINHFDGLDLDWEYPAYRDGGKPRDKDNYAQLVQELREEFERESDKTGRPRLLLTMAVPAGIEYIDKGYDIPRLNKYLDFMNILSYDYHSAFEPSVNHHSPLYSIEEESEYNFDSGLTIDATVKHYILKGADAEKLVLGIPTYGRSYTLFNDQSTDLGSPADGPGEQGDATREKGYLAYYEICDNVKNGWTVVQPKETALGPYAFKGNQWVGYDDESIVKKKSQYVNEKNLGGIMFWSIDNDDFRGKCHTRPYPLIEAAKEALLGKGAGVAANKLPSGPRGGKGTGSLSKTSSKLKNHRIPLTPPTTTSQASATQTTPDPPTTPDPGSDFVCKDEGFFPHPRDCKKYFWCLDSGPSNLGIVAHQFTCPSGLFFNKAADSCDFARNVICKKKSADSTTTITTSSPKSSTTVAKFATTQRTTTTSTTSTTTETPPEVEDEEEEYYEEQEDPQTIKQLISLIKKLGGVAELEKQLEGNSNSGVDTTTPAISKSLYERVISKQIPRSQNFQRNGPTGPQNEGLPRDSGRSSFRKDKPAYVTIQRERPTTEKLSADEFEEEFEKTEERPKYKPIQRNRGSQIEGVQTERPAEKNTLRYQTVERFRTTPRERTENPKDEDGESEAVAPSIERRQQSSTLRYTNISRGRSTTANAGSSTTSRYVTLQRQHSQPENGDVVTTENELIDEEDITEESVVDTTTTSQKPRMKVSEVLTTTPGVRTSTRVVTQVVEGATQRQRVRLNMLHQLLTDSENFVDSVTQPYTQETVTEALKPSRFRTRRPIVVSTTLRTTPAYVALRRIRPSTTTEVVNTISKHKGFIPSRSRGKSTTESNDSAEDVHSESTSEPQSEDRERSEKPQRGFFPRQRSTTTVPSRVTTRGHFERNRFSGRGTTTKRPSEEDDQLFTREYSRDTNVIRRPVSKVRFPSQRFTTSPTVDRTTSEIVSTENSTSMKSLALESSTTERLSSAQSSRPNSSTDQTTSEIVNNNGTVPSVLVITTTLASIVDSVVSTPSYTANVSSTISSENPATDNPVTVGVSPSLNETTANLPTSTHRFNRPRENSTQRNILTSVTLSDSVTGSSDRVIGNRTKIILRRKKPVDHNSDINSIKPVGGRKPSTREKVIIRRKKPETTPKSLDVFEEDERFLEKRVSTTDGLGASRGRARFVTTVTIDELLSDQTTPLIASKNGDSTSSRSRSLRARTSDQGTTTPAVSERVTRTKLTSRQGGSVEPDKGGDKITRSRFPHDSSTSRSYEGTRNAESVSDLRAPRSREHSREENTRRTSSGDNSRAKQDERRRQRVTSSVVDDGKPKIIGQTQRGQKKFELGKKPLSEEDIETDSLPRKQSSQSPTIIASKDKNNASDRTKKVKRVVLKKPLRDLAVGESGIPDPKIYDNELLDEDPLTSSITLYNSLLDEDFDLLNLAEEAPQNNVTEGGSEVSRSRRPFHRRPGGGSRKDTLTTSTTEFPTTSRQPTTVQILKQRLNRLKTGRGQQTLRTTTTVENIVAEGEASTTLRPRRKEFRRVIRPSTFQSFEQTPQLDSSIEQSVTKDTVTKTQQFHRETSFRPQGHLKHTTAPSPRNVPSPAEEVDTYGGSSGQADSVTEAELSSYELDEDSIPDLANVAVAAIQSLATSAPINPTEKYVSPTVQPNVREIPLTTEQPKPRQPFLPRPLSTFPPSRGVARSSPRPFSKSLPGSVSPQQVRSPLEPSRGIIREDYDDFYAEPVDIPLSGKVRIHNDGYIECLDIGNFPHPFSCRKFISCAKMENSHLLGWEYTCPKGLSFDPIGGICNWNAGLGCKE